MTGRTLYEATTALRLEFGFGPSALWEALTWRERDRWEDLAVELAAQDEEAA